MDTLSPLARYALEGLALSAALLVLVAGCRYLFVHDDLPGPMNGSPDKVFYISKRTRVSAEIRRDMDNPWGLR
jgi:hypothetical protein